jgi:hypothetical protein
MTCLKVAAATCLAPWGTVAADFPGASTEQPPNLRGFAISRFAPLVAEVARQCVAEGGPLDEGTRTGIVLATVFGDSTSADVDAQRRLAGQTCNPLLFYQSVVTSVLGVVCRDHHLTGPVCCLSVCDNPMAQALETAELVVSGGEADQVLLIAVELDANERTSRICELLAAGGYPLEMPISDAAVALLLQPCLKEDHGEAISELAYGDLFAFGYLQGLVGVCQEFQRSRANPGQPVVLCGTVGEQAGVYRG